ncbi:MAG: rhodanese-related sulfurtransferase [bacterium]
MRRVLAFYKFTAVDELQALHQELLATGARLRLKGTILLAHEGVNGTVVGTTAALTELTQLLHQRFGEIPFKWSDLAQENRGFFRFKVKIKPEIVSFGVADLDLNQTGEHVDAQRWNELLADPEVLVIDTRNRYEIDIGTFPAACSPQTTNFREFPNWVREQLNPGEQKKIAMFCTGGIRCEKASAFMRQAGFEQVYQLDGGILKYLEEVEEEENRWQGECFVFDQRVSVDKGLKQGQYEQCYACRHPLSREDLSSEVYEQGVQCPHCVGEATQARLDGFRQRQRQIELARQRGTEHIGEAQKQAAEPGPDRNPDYRSGNSSSHTASSNSG